MCWHTTLHTVLELLYFASGIAIAVAAFIGLKQISISKEVARSNARRESVRYAAEQCRNLAETVIPAHTEFAERYNGAKLTFLNPKQPPAFAVEGAEIVLKNYDLTMMDKEWNAVANPLINYLNTLESFAIPFAEGVADEDIGFREAARPFCGTAQFCLPAIFQLRRMNAGRYESVVKLLSLWSKRLAAELAKPVLDVLNGLMKEAGEGRIKPIGPVF